MVQIETHVAHPSRMLVTAVLAKIAGFASSRKRRNDMRPKTPVFDPVYLLRRCPHREKTACNTLTRESEQSHGCLPGCYALGLVPSVRCEKSEVGAERGDACPSFAFLCEGRPHPGPQLHTIYTPAPRRAVTVLKSISYPTRHFVDALSVRGPGVLVTLRPPPSLRPLKFKGLEV